MTCPSLETLAAWIMGDEAEDLESHLFACDRCAGRAEGLQRLTHGLYAALPGLLTVERRARLETAGPMPSVTVAPGETGTIVLGGGVEVGLWVLKAELAGVERLDFELCAVDGPTLVSFPDVPFDPDRGEVVLACQTHYQTMGFPDQLVARTVSVGPSGTTPVAEYRLNHVFRV